MNNTDDTIQVLSQELLDHAYNQDLRSRASIGLTEMILRTT